MQGVPVKQGGGAEAVQGPVYVGPQFACVWKHVPNMVTQPLPVFGIQIVAVGGTVCGCAHKIVQGGYEVAQPACVIGQKGHEVGQTGPVFVQGMLGIVCGAACAAPA